MRYLVAVVAYTLFLVWLVEVNPIMAGVLILITGFYAVSEN